MDKLFTGAAICVFGLTSWLAKTVAGHSELFAQSEIVRETDQLDILPVFKALADYGLSAGILVAGYFACCKLINRIGDRLEKKMDDNHDETKEMLNEIMKGSKS